MTRRSSTRLTSRPIRIAVPSVSVTSILPSAEVRLGVSRFGGEGDLKAHQSSSVVPVSMAGSLLPDTHRFEGKVIREYPYPMLGPIRPHGLVR